MASRYRWRQQLLGSLQGITIQRSIKVTPGDANQLEVHYATTTTSTIQTSFHATLTPEALAWCP